MNENRKSFYQYAVKYSTQIPIIQRDYAQGREGKNEQAVLKRFLLDIADSLDNDKPLSLNFIYGIEEKNDVFLPIDGQQRLTTLFLLHWFVALRTEHLDKFLEDTKNFTYQTRSSAIDFFASIQPSPDKIEGKERIKELYKIQSGSAIKDFPWFKLDWSYDQTIAGVINALNRMFELFATKNFDDWWEKLVSTQKCKITFLYITINKTENNDGNELENQTKAANKSERNVGNEMKNETKAALTYIKMNARGKHLSEFENAKALIHGLNNKEGVEFVISFDNKYIKSIELIASKSDKAEKDIGQISITIDKMMMQLLINLFNDLRYLFNELLSKESLSKSNEADYLNYMDALRDFHEHPDKEKNFFYCRYFDILNRLFSSEIINCDEFKNYVKGNQRPARLDFCLLLSYFYYHGYNSQRINEWKYLFRNFHYKDTNNTQDGDNYYKILSSLNNLSEDIGNKNVSGSPVIYVSKEPDLPEFIKIPSVKSGDWKEEHIKSKIIRENGLNFDYFNAIEENFDRRIRAFLFMSDFWNGSGGKTNLDSYIALSTGLKLKFDEQIPMEIKKIYYLLATGFNGAAKSKIRPYIDNALYNWSEPNDDVQENLHVLSFVFDFLNNNHYNTIELINIKINEIARELYNKKDWHSFILTRNRDELFYHLDGEKLHISDDENINIFNYVKQLDLGGKPIKGNINFQKNKNIGTIGQNNRSKYTITYEYILNVDIILKGEHVPDYAFYKYNDTLFKIFRYIDYQEGKHQFEALEFDIAKNLEKYIEFARKIYKKFDGLPTEEKTEPIYSKDYSNLKDYCKTICDDNTKIKIWSYYNTIITRFDIDITVDLNGPDINKTTETLDLLEK